MDYTERDLISNPLNAEELKKMAQDGGTAVRGLINPKSAVFKKMNVKIDDLDDNGAIELVGANPRILLRPLLKAPGVYIAGFSESSYQTVLNKL